MQHLRVALEEALAHPPAPKQGPPPPPSSPCSSYTPSGVHGSGMSDAGLTIVPEDSVSNAADAQPKLKYRKGGRQGTGGAGFSSLHERKSFFQVRVVQGMVVNFGARAGVQKFQMQMLVFRRLR